MIMTSVAAGQWGQVAHPEIDYDYKVWGAADLEAGKLAARRVLSMHAPANAAGTVLLAVAMWHGPARLSSAAWSAAFVALKVGGLVFFLVRLLPTR